ncbi:MAG: 2-C-methyl-D-erythritol 4-phosphate cytidylyltransferase [Actinomycetota bacterium]
MEQRQVVAAVVLAAGSGSRMGSEPRLPKQFLPLVGDERLVDRTVATCRAVADWVGLALPPDTAWDGPAVDERVVGGGSRMETVAAVCAAVPSSADVVVIHSASHPLASAVLLRRAIDAVVTGADGAVAVLDVVDTVKRRHADGSLTTLGREGLGTAQAPMAYRRVMLDRALDALAADQDPAIVEESMAIEAIGGRVVSVPGESTNLHVTDPVSLAVVRRLVDLV